MWAISAFQMHSHAIMVADEAVYDELKVDSYMYLRILRKIIC